MLVSNGYWLRMLENPLIKCRNAGEMRTIENLTAPFVGLSCYIILWNINCRLTCFIDAGRIVCGKRLCNSRVSVLPFVCLPVCPVDRQQQRRAPGLLLTGCRSQSAARCSPGASTFSGFWSVSLLGVHSEKFIIDCLIGPLYLSLRPQSQTLIWDRSLRPN